MTRSSSPSTSLAGLHEAGIAVTDIDCVEGLPASEFQRRFYSSSQPVVIRAGVTDWPAIDRWSPEYLASRLNLEAVDIVPGPSAFPIGESRQPPAVRREQFIEYLQRIFNNDRPSTDGTGYLREESLFGRAAGLLDDVYVPDWVPDARLLIDMNVWIGPSGNITPLHYDQMHNLLAQVRGVKDILLLAPDDLESAYLWPSNGALDRRSRVDLSSIDLHKFPRLANAQFFHATLREGDVLYMPAYWLHDVQTVDPSISVNVWWRPPLAHCLLPGLFRFLVRDRTFSYPRDMMARAIDLGSADYTSMLDVVQTLVEGGQSESAAVLAGALLAEHYRFRAGIQAADQQANETVTLFPAHADILNELCRNGLAPADEALRAEKLLNDVERLRGGETDPYPGLAVDILAHADRIGGLVPTH